MKRSAAQRRTLSPFQQYFISATVVLALFVGIGGYWGYRTVVVDHHRETLARVSLDRAAQQASAVAQQLESARAQLRELAQSEAVGPALAGNGRSTTDRLEADLRQKLPALRELRVFPKGAAQLDREAETPIRFAELDMINKAERRQAVVSEASEVADEWRISMVEPIPQGEDDQSPVTGVVFASFAAGELLSGGDTPEGSVQVLQRYPGQQPRLIGQRGNAQAQAQAQESPVSNSYLLIRFAPSASLADQVGSRASLFFASLAAVVIAGLAVSYFVAQTATRRAPAQSGAAEVERRQADDLLDVEVSEEDKELLGIKAMAQRADEDDPLDIQDSPLAEAIPAEIFRSYDIRGVAASQLTPANVVLIGQAIGSAVLAAGEGEIVVARDGRNHSPEITEQLIEGILATGCNVLNIGMVPTPMMYFACHELQSTSSGVMVTASHNPPEYNGFKIVIAGDTLKDESIQALRTRIEERNFNKGAGKEEFTDVSNQYIERIFADVALAGELSVVVDAGNGVAGKIAPRLFEELGCTVTPLYCEVDGNFPNHQPDPSVAANLKDLVTKVQEVDADLGIALDGDADRVAVVTASGQIVSADRLLMVLAKDIVSRNPGADVIFDVKCSRELNKVITSYGGRPIMWKAGHSHMKAKMKETGALLGGELSGHIFIKERWYGFDDGLYAAARILEIMSLREQDLDGILESFPALPATPEIKIPVDESEKVKLIQQLIRKGEFGEGRLTTMDGLRVDFADGWGLVRPSNTSAALTLRFEAESDAALNEIVDRFKQQLARLEPPLKLNF
ncbi:phosphomannomutase/phosphoglucomutase [Proteobacteria bacterium 005FR1]|nr:phosphomannomutase/phosphoglucomutase [Proteobacteria bacterium 005FR1]